MKRLFTSFCLAISIACVAMEECDVSKISQIQTSTHPLRHDLRKLKKAIAFYKHKLCDTHLKEKFKGDEECFIWQDGRVSYLLDSVLKELDHAIMDTHNKKFLHLDKYFNNAYEHLNKAKAELAEYKNNVKKIANIDIDTQAKL
jgi:hypothetical protein